MVEAGIVRAEPAADSGTVVFHGGNCMLIDLRELREPLAAGIRTSLAEFVAGHPDTPVSTVGLFGDGFHGTALLHLDTPGHSAGFVAKWLAKGPDWYGEDAYGRFCNNCPDMSHCIGEFRFPGYPDLYQEPVDAAVDFITLEGVRVRAEAVDGDEGKHRIVFPFLRHVLSGFAPFDGLVPAAPFRAGVQMHDSACAEFWLVERGR